MEKLIEFLEAKRYREILHDCESKTFTVLDSKTCADLADTWAKFNAKDDLVTEVLSEIHFIQNPTGRK